MSLSLHNGKETREYVVDWIEKYTDIGQMYSTYLTRESKEKSRSEENERNWIQWSSSGSIRYTKSY